MERGEKTKKLILIQTLQKSFYKNGYLVIIAACLYTISILIVNYWSFKSSPHKVKERFENYIKTSEQRFEAIAKDTITLRYILYDTTKPQPYLYEVNKQL